MRAPWITRGAALLCAVSLLVSGWALYSWTTESTKRRADESRAWRTVVCYLEDQVYAAKIPAGRKLAAIRVYDHILVLVDAAPCATKGA